MGKRGPKQQFTDIACPNRDCEKYGQTGQGNIVGNGTYKASGEVVRKFLCRCCGHTFNSRTGTVYEGIRTNVDKMDEAMECLQSGMSVSETASKLGLSSATVRRWYSNMASVSRLQPMMDSTENVKKIDNLWGSAITWIDHPSIPKELILLPERLTKFLRLCTAICVSELDIKRHHIAFVLKLGAQPRMTLREFANVLPFDRSRISFVLKEMIDQGFVTQENDQKPAKYSLTPQGMEQYERLRELSRNVFRMVFAAFSEEESMQIRKGIGRLNNRLDEISDRISSRLGQDFE